MASRYFFKLLKPKPNVPKTDYQKSLRDLKIQVQKTKESIIKKSKEFKSKIEKDKPVVKHYYAPKDFLK